MPFKLGPNPSPNVRALHAWLDGLEKWDIDLIMAPMDDTLVHQVLPASLGRPARNKSEFAAFFSSGMPMFASFSIDVDELVETPDKIVIHAKSVGKSVFGTPYANEYAIFLTFVDSPAGDGERKISKIWEFVDSEFSKGFFERERAKMAEQEARKAQ